LAGASCSGYASQAYLDVSALAVRAGGKIDHRGSRGLTIALHRGVNFTRGGARIAEWKKTLKTSLSILPWLMR
jgi:hypothetical protein